MARNEQITSSLVIQQPDSGVTPSLPNGSVSDANVLAGVQLIKISGVTTGSIPFVGSGSTHPMAEDNSHLFYDSVNIRVGIGTNSPSHSLHVVDLVSEQYVAGFYHYTSDVNGSQLKLFKGRGTPGSPSAVQSGDTLGGMDFRGYSTSDVPGAAITAIAGSLWSVSNNETYITFGVTQPASTSVTEVMRIARTAGSPAISIGTTSTVGAALQVTGGNVAVFGNNAFINFGVGQPGGSNLEYVFMQHGGSGGQAQIAVQSAGTGVLRNLLFQMQASTVMTLDTTGQLGIGVTPTAKLDVNGIGIVRNQLLVNTPTADGASIAFVGGTTPITGASVNGLSVTYTGVATNTSNIKGIITTVTTPASIAVARVTGVQTNYTVGAAGTVPLYVGFIDLGAATHAASTASASFTDTGSPNTGNWFLFQNGSDLSALSGKLLVGKTTQTSGLSGGFEVKNNTASTFSGILSDSGGRCLRLATSDYVDSTNTGSVMSFTLGAGTGNTYASLQTFISGTSNSASGIFALQANGGSVGIGTSAPAGTSILDLKRNSGDPTASSHTGSLVLESADGRTSLGVGITGSGQSGAWLQSLNQPPGGQTFALLLNPLGGAIGIGTSNTTLDTNVNVQLGNASQRNVLEITGTSTTDFLPMIDFFRASVSNWMIGLHSSNSLMVSSAGHGTYTDAALSSGCALALSATDNTVIIGGTTKVNAAAQLSIGGSGQMAFTDGSNGGALRFAASAGGSVVGLFNIGLSVGLASAGDSSWTLTNGSGHVMYVQNNGAGGVQLTNGSTSWAAVSDENLKIIIEPISNSLEKVTQLRTVIGRYKNDEETRRRPFLIAQDVQKVLPEAVVEDSKGILSLSYTDVIPLLIAAIKDLKSEVDSLKSKLLH